MKRLFATLFMMLMIPLVTLVAEPVFDHPDYPIEQVVQMDFDVAVIADIQYDTGPEILTVHNFTNEQTIEVDHEIRLQTIPPLIRGSYILNLELLLEDRQLDTDSYSQLYRPNQKHSVLFKMKNGKEVLTEFSSLFS